MKKLAVTHCQGDDVGFDFIHTQVKEGWSVKLCCDAVGLSRSGYYAWITRPATLISEDTLMLYRRAKALFNESRQSLGSRGLMYALQKEGFTVGRSQVRTLMLKLKLVVYQLVA